MKEKKIVSLSNILGIVSIFLLIYWVFTFITMEVFGLKVFRDGDGLHARSASDAAKLGERLAEGRGSATVATAENNRVTGPFLMPREPRYLQRLVRPGSGDEAAMFEFALP